MRRASIGTFESADTSESVVPSSSTRPASGLSKPATKFTSVLLPHPDRPNNAMMPGVGASMDTSKTKSPRCFLSCRLSTRLASESFAHETREEFRQQQPRQAENKGNRREPRGQDIAVR